MITAAAAAQEAILKDASLKEEGLLRDFLTTVMPSDSAGEDCRCVQLITANASSAIGSFSFISSSRLRSSCSSLTLRSPEKYLSIIL